MTMLDIFVAVIVVSSILGLITLSLSYVAITGITLIQNATANIPTYTPASLSNSLSSTAGMLPDLAVIFVIVLIVFSWMLSAFIKSSPIAVVISIVWLIFYTMVAFFMAHYLISTVDSITIFKSLGSGPNLLYLFWANLPIILLVSSLVDITIAVLAYRTA
jgi:hypothetical protein